MAKNTAEEKIKLSGIEAQEDDAEDYIFRFNIKPGERSLEPDSVLKDFYRDQIRDLFKIVFFNKDGEKIIPTEFGFLNEQDKKYPLWSDE